MTRPTALIVAIAGVALIAGCAPRGAVYSQGYRAGYADAADACNNAMDGVLSDSLCACVRRER